MAGNRPSVPQRLGGLVVVAYLLAWFYAFAVLRAVLPRACWVVRLERHWIGMWMR